MYTLVHVVSHTTIMLLGNIGLVLPVGIVVCRELPSHIIERLYNHPYLVSSCFYAIPFSTIRRIFYSKLATPLVQILYMAC